MSTARTAELQVNPVRMIRTVFEDFVSKAGAGPGAKFSKLLKSSQEDLGKIID